VATLAASGYGAEGLVAVDGDRVTARFDDVAGLVAAPASRGRRFRFLVSAAALLVVLGAYLPLYRIESATDRIEREAALLQRTGEANPGTAPLAIIAAAKSTAPSPLAILNRLSGGLPDGTWLTQLTLAGNDLTIEGRTPTAASLVRIVENIAGFGTVSYVAPVTRDPSGEGERFAFALKVAGERQ
jgi:Tfp pilus assembly protein PilN